MGATSCPLVLFSLLLLFLTTNLTPSDSSSTSLLDDNGATVNTVATDNDTDKITTANPSPSPPSPSSQPPPLPLVSKTYTAFRPSIAVIVGVLTTMFSLTFLFLLYAKHCKRAGSVVIIGYVSGRSGSRDLNFPISSAAKKNSGIDRSVIEFLPIFRFGSLMGQKEGLECAVCLNKFETTEVLRLLPKCKHAFHVECIDTWLDAHSTCPLCRYRVDPEDILLAEDVKIFHNSNINNNNNIQPIINPQNHVNSDDSIVHVETGRRSGIESSNSGYRRVSGRHSSAGEKGTVGFWQMIRRSLDSSSTEISRKKSESTVAVGCFDRPRKDGLLLTSEDKTRVILDRSRFEHRIVVSPGPVVLEGGNHQRWSDVQPLDLLYLQSEMIISSQSALQRHKQKTKAEEEEEADEEGIDGNSWDGRRVINERSVSEITGVEKVLEYRE